MTGWLLAAAAILAGAVFLRTVARHDEHATTPLPTPRQRIVEAALVGLCCGSAIPAAAYLLGLT